MWRDHEEIAWSRNLTFTWPVDMTWSQVPSVSRDVTYLCQVMILFQVRVSRSVITLQCYVRWLSHVKSQCHATSWRHVKLVSRNKTVIRDSLLGLANALASWSDVDCCKVLTSLTWRHHWGYWGKEFIVGLLYLNYSVIILRKRVLNAFYFPSCLGRRRGNAHTDELCEAPNCLKDQNCYGFYTKAL